MGTGVKEYYAIVGLGELTKEPSGLLRKNQDPPWIPQQFNRYTLEWEESKSAYSYFFGMDDDYEEITEAEAEEVIKKWKADKALINIPIRVEGEGMIGDATLQLTDEEVQKIEKIAGSLDSLDELEILDLVDKIRKKSD